jgi:hypothetical protein
MMEKTMAICPICSSDVKPLDRTGDFDGFDCPKDGPFKVAGSAMSTKGEATRQQWESALASAKARSNRRMAYDYD